MAILMPRLLTVAHVVMSNGCMHRETPAWTMMVVAHDVAILSSRPSVTINRIPCGELLGAPVPGVDMMPFMAVSAAAKSVLVSTSWFEQVVKLFLQTTRTSTPAAAVPASVRFDVLGWMV